MADTIAANVLVRLEEKQEILEIKDPLERLERLLVLLTHEIDVQRIEQKINHRVRKSIDRMQKGALSARADQGYSAGARRGPATRSTNSAGR